MITLNYKCISKIYKISLTEDLCRLLPLVLEMSEISMAEVQTLVTFGISPVLLLTFWGDLIVVPLRLWITAGKIALTVVYGLSNVEKSRNAWVLSEMFIINL